MTTTTTNNNNEEEIVPLTQPQDAEGDTTTTMTPLSYEYNPKKDDYYSTISTTTTASKYLPPWLLQKLYPPDTPPSIQLLRLENCAIPACYLCVGILQGLSGPLFNVYPLYLGATEAQQTTIMSLRSLPASLKIVFGFWSDTVPLWGYRRKAYMCIGWLLSSFSMMVLSRWSNLQRLNDETPPEDAPSIAFLSTIVLLFGTGFWLADVMGDSLVAEKAKLEGPSQKGQLQSTCYACRFFGVMVCSPIATLLLNNNRNGIVVVVNLLLWTPLVLCLIPIYYLGEARNAVVRPVRDQLQEIWNTVGSRAVWQPMGFVYLYNLLQIPNAAWKEFLKSVLLFEDWQLNTLLVIANVLVYVGVMAYKYYFIKYSWRTIYIGTTVLNSVLSLGQVLLITNLIPFGLSPFVFALGDDIIVDFVAGIQFLPTTIMMVHLCPSGSEGASYAMFTTVSNCAFGLAGAASTILTNIWDVRKDTMVGGDTSGILKLSLFTTALQTSGLLFVRLLPRTKDDLAALHHNDQHSAWGGGIFLTITLCSVGYAIVVSGLNVLAPGWAGES